MVTSLAFQVGLKSCALNHPDEVGAPIVGVDLLDLCLLITLICPLASAAQELPFDRERAGDGAAKVNWGLLIIKVRVNLDKYILLSIGTNPFFNSWKYILSFDQKLARESKTPTQSDQEKMLQLSSDAVSIKDM